LVWGDRATVPWRAAGGNLPALKGYMLRCLDAALLLQEACGSRWMLARV